MDITDNNKKMARGDMPFSFILVGIGFYACYKNFLMSDYLGLLGGAFLLTLGIFWVWMNIRILTH